VAPSIATHPGDAASPGVQDHKPAIDPRPSKAARHNWPLIFVVVVVLLVLHGVVIAGIGIVWFLFELASHFDGVCNPRC
jgi:hypothetical protein